MIDLSNVSLVIIDDYKDDVSKNNIRYIINQKTKSFALDNIKFGNIIEVTPFGNFSEYEFAGGQIDYSKFCVKTLPYLVNTEYYLIQQWDGFIINPNKWSSEFLEYEYIGGGHTLQCGGFSLRKTKDMRKIAELSDETVCDNEFEDAYYSRFFNESGKPKPPFEYYFKKPYIKITDTNISNSITERFCSFLNPNKNSFGFHFSETNIDYLDYYKIINKFSQEELIKISEYLKQREIRWK